MKYKSKMSVITLVIYGKIFMIVSRSNLMCTEVFINLNILMILTPLITVVAVVTLPPTSKILRIIPISDPTTMKKSKQFQVL